MAEMSRLSEELAETRAASPLPPEVQEKISRMVAELDREEVAAGLAAPGDVVPPLAFDHFGSAWKLEEALESGPVVLIFYRGGWCPYCNVHLRAFARQAEEIEALGGQLVAASPFAPEESANSEELEALPITVVTDLGLRGAEALGLTFTPPDYVVEAYRDLGRSLEELTGFSPPRLTIPGTLVIGSGRRVHFSHADIDYRTRVEPDAVIASLRGVAASAPR